MSSKASGVIRKEQPLAEYTHCRNHILNLAISCTCKNQSIKKILDNLTSLCIFFENLPNRQKCFEYFWEFNKVNLNLPETKRKKVIGLVKTRWVQRYKAYGTYHLLHKSTIFTFERYKAYTVHIICYTNQQFSLLSQSKKEIYMLSFTNIYRKCVTKPGRGMQKLK